MSGVFKNSGVTSFTSIRDLEGLQNIFQSDNKLNRTVLSWFKPEQILDQAGDVHGDFWVRWL